MEEEAPIVRIAKALEDIVCLLEKVANPPLMVRANVNDKEITYTF